MLTRRTGYLTLRHPGAGNAAAKQLQAEGYVVLEQVFDTKTVDTLADEVERVYEEYPPDERSSRYPHEHWEPFRYEMLNRSAAVQRAIANRKILSSIEPLLGEDCHVIANTAWWQPPDNNKHGGRFWHIDSGPHVPRPPGVPWDERIPYPVFAVAAHLYLMDCPLKAGPTGVIPRSHMSGQPPPLERMADDDLEYDGVKADTAGRQGGRRRALRLRHLAPAAALAPRRPGPHVHPVPLRAARPRPADPADGRGEPPLRRGTGPGQEPRGSRPSSGSTATGSTTVDAAAHLSRH